jgi:hypothetical protein
MRFHGEWFECDDGIVRPIMQAEILSANRRWIPAALLVDTGADRTIFSSDLLHALKLEFQPAQHSVCGLGGFVDSVTVSTQIRLTRDDGEKVLFRGSYAGCTRYESLDMAVLGRDILDMFGVIVDRPADLVTILGGNHYYTIHRR